MEVDKKKVLKWVILSFSFFMFCYQAEIAIRKLMSPPVIDSTDIHSLADIQLPLITICAKKQWNKTKLLKFGYYNEIEFLAGYGGLDKEDYVFAWGAQHNISYDELLDGILNINSSNPYEVEKPEEDQADRYIYVYEHRFYPRFGLCADILNYTLNENGDAVFDIEVNMKYQFYDNATQIYRNNFEAEVFLTDNHLRTKTSVHLQSHWGSNIIIENGWDDQYVIQVEQLSNFNPRKEEECRDYVDQEYANIAKENLQDLFKPLIDCIPPWVSEKDQCTGVINATEEVTDKYWYNTEVYNTFKSISKMVDYPALESCTKPCNVKRSNVLLNSNKFTEKTLLSSTLRLKFDILVVHRTKILAYGFSDFLIDLGSSLGLWFGLSVFGITDLGIAALHLLKRMRVITRRKKKMNVTSKFIRIHRYILTII